MKITNKQLQAIASSIAEKIKVRRDRRKLELQKSVKIELTAKEDEFFTLIELAGKIIPKDLCPYITDHVRGYRKSLRKDHVNHKRSETIERILEAEGYVYPSEDNIYKDLIIASIDDMTLEELIANLGKRLGINLDKL